MHPAKKPRRRRRWLFIALPVIVLGLLVYMAIPGKMTYTVGPETTYATDPVGPDGFVDNVAALNARLRGDITPEKNANVFIWQAIGPHPERGTMPDEYFQWLGRPAPPEPGEYMVPWHTFVKGKAGAKPEDAMPPGIDMEHENARQARAIKWPWAAADEPGLAEWVKKNARPLAAFTQASTRPAYYNPLVPRRNPDGTNGQLIACLLPNVQVCREGANLLVCRAMMHLGAGRTEEAWQDLVTCHRLGRVMEKGGTLIEYLVGVAIEHVALNGEIVFLSQAKLSAAQVAACRADLGQLPAPSPLADKVDVTERFGTLDVLQWVIRVGPDALKQLDGAGFGQAPAAGLRLFARGTDWDPAMRLVNSWYDRLAAATRLADPMERTRVLGELEAELKTMQQEAKEEMWAAPVLGPRQRGELFGKILLGLMLPAVNKMAEAEIRTAQHHRNLAVVFALAAHRADRGQYPAALADLAPAYLPEVPKDIYTDGDLKYQRTAAGYRLYSVGPNKTDDQGRGRDANPPGDDWAVEMPAKEPPPVKKPVEEPE